MSMSLLCVFLLSLKEGDPGEEREGRRGGYPREAREATFRGGLT